MRKAVPLAAIVAALVFAAAALAVTNTYTVSASITPAKQGSKKKPVPIGLVFNYTVGEQNNNRPGLISKYSIGFAGVRTHGELFPACTAAQINSAQGDSGCAAGSKVGSGVVENVAGATSKPSDRSLACHLDLTIYNSGKNRAALYLHGGPSGFSQPCAIAVSQAIDAQFVPGPQGGSSLEFTVPPTLLHPVPGIDNSVIKTESTILNRTATVKAKGKKKKGKKKKAQKVGYFESAGGCSASKRTVSVTFTTDQGQVTSTSTAVPCTK